MRSVNFEKIMNFRNLGGYECTYGETAFGVLYRSGRLFGASVSDINKLYSLGLKTIIDIRDTNADGQYNKTVTTLAAMQTAVEKKADGVVIGYEVSLDMYVDDGAVLIVVTDISVGD